MMKGWSTRFLARFFPRRSAGDETADVLEIGHERGACFGRQGPESPELSFAMQKRAATGNVVAQNSLGLMFSSGDGGVRNMLEARKWFRRAADQGDAGAQFNLANLCHPANLGQRVTQFEEARIEAYMWFSLASAQGHRNAEASCEMLNLQMTDAELHEGNRRASAFRPTKEPPAPSANSTFP